MLSARKSCEITDRGGDALLVGVATSVEWLIAILVSDAAVVVVVLVDMDWAWLGGGDTGVSGGSATPLSKAA